MLGFKRDPEDVINNGLDINELHDHVLNNYGEDLNDDILKKLKTDIEFAATQVYSWCGVDLPDYLAAYYDELDAHMEDLDSIGDMLW